MHFNLSFQLCLSILSNQTSLTLHINQHVTQVQRMTHQTEFAHQPSVSGWAEGLHAVEVPACRESTCVWVTAQLIKEKETLRHTHTVDTIITHFHLSSCQISAQRAGLSPSSSVVMHMLPQDTNAMRGTSVIHSPHFEQLPDQRTACRPLPIFSCNAQLFIALTVLISPLFCCISL